MPDLELPDGRIIQDIPEGLSKDQIAAKLIGSGILTGKEDWLNTQSSAQSSKESNIKSYFPGVSDEQLSQRINQAANNSEEDKRLLALPYRVLGGGAQGFGNALIGGVQGATDIGEGAARAIEKSIYGDVMPQQTFGNRLAQQVEKLKTEQSKLSGAERFGIGAGQITPELVATRNMGLVPGSVVSGLIAGFFSPEEQSGVEKRVLNSLKAGTESGAYAYGLSKAGQALSSEPAQKLLGKTKQFAEALKDRLVSQFGKGEAATEASKAIAKKTFQKGFEAEGLNAKDLFENLQKNNLDLIDAIDPRFATYGKIKGALTTPENIKKVDASLANVKQSTDDLQKSLTGMVATKQLTPQEAGEVLGRNSKKIFDRAIEARKLKADPYYTKGLNAGTKIDPKSVIPLDQQTLSALGVKKLTLGDVLKSNLGQDVINTARGQASVFAKTPGGKFYGQLSQKTKPVFEEVKKLAGADEGGVPQYVTEQILKDPAKFKIADNDVRTLYAMENVLTDRIGNVKLTGASKEEAALIATKKAISGLLNKANPALEKARSIWSSDTKDIMGEGKSLIGKFAKMYSDGRADDLAKASMNILDLPERAIKLAQKQAPDEFGQILRSSIENRLASIKPLDDSVIKQRPFYSALFSDGGKNLKTALNDDQLFNGFKNLATQLDRGAKRQALARSAAESQAKAVNIATGKTSFMNRVLEKTADTIMNAPKAQSQMVDYALTPQGMTLLKELAKEKAPKESEKKIINFLTNSGVISKDDVIKLLAVSTGRDGLFSDNQQPSEQ